jgi:hypothetical protein
MITKADIETAGGKCELVSVDFWECTDKDGKKWWCSDHGNKCVPKPRAGAPGDINPTINETMDPGDLTDGPRDDLRREDPGDDIGTLKLP